MKPPVFVATELALRRRGKKTVKLVVRFHRPTRHRGHYACLCTIRVDGKPLTILRPSEHPIYGADPLQALLLAMKFAVVEIEELLVRAKTHIVSPIWDDMQLLGSRRVI